MQQTIITRKSKAELLPRCIELESRGFTCISPIQPEHRYRKHYHYQDNSHPRLARKRFTGAEEYTKWRAVYQKEDEANGRNPNERTI